MNRHSTKGGIQVADKCMKRYSISLVTREMQVETTMRYYCTPIRMVKMKNSDNTKCYQGFRVIGSLHLYIAGRNVNGTATLENSLAVS